MDLIDKAREKLFGALDGQQQKIENAEDQSDDEKKLCAFVKTKVEEGRSQGSRIAHEGIWMTNTAYVLGFDSVYYDTTTRQYRPIGTTTTTSNRRSRVHINKILPTIQNRTARLTKSPPKYDILPESNSTDDKDAARLGLHIIDDVWNRQRINEKRISLMMWLQQCGHAYLKVAWDPTMGKPLPNPEGGFIGYEGDIRIDVVSAFEVFADPLAKSLDEASYVVQAKVRKLDYFVNTYPERGELVKEEGAWLLSTQYELRINSLNNQGPVSAGTEAQMKGAAIELAYYEKRSQKHPDGRLIIVANGVLLHDGPLPVGEIPFVKFDDIIVAGKYMSESVITHLRPIQDQYNRLVTRRADWTNKLLAGKYLAPKGSGLNQEAFNDKSGELIEYDPVPGAQPPTPIPIPNIPQWAYEEEEKYIEMFNEISGIMEIDKGNLDQAGIPAIGMQFMQEQSATRMGVMVEQHEQAYAKLGKLILKYAQAFYKTDRVLKLAGSGLEYTVKHFTGADIKDNHDVIVVRGSTVPNSKVLKRQEILNAYQQGLLGQQGDPKVITNVLDMIEFGESENMWQDHSLDMRQIKEHIDMIENEQEPPVDEADNHELFIQELNRYRKSDKYSELSSTSQYLMKQCMEDHLQALVQLTNPAVGRDKQLADGMVDAHESGQVQPQDVDLAPQPEPAGAQLAIENQNIADNAIR